MLNKLYVIGNKQKEIVERCFIHNRGTYISPMTDGDLFALTATQPVHKSHKNIEIFGHSFFPSPSFCTTVEAKPLEVTQRRFGGVVFCSPR